MKKLLIGMAILASGAFAQAETSADQSADFGRIVVRCESIDFRPAACSVPYGARIIRVQQRSKAACVWGQTFGQGRNHIWVNNGCRADFLVRY